MYRDTVKKGVCFTLGKQIPLSQYNILNLLQMLKKLEVLVQDKHSQCGTAPLHPETPAMCLFSHRVLDKT